MACFISVLPTQIETYVVQFWAYLITVSIWINLNVRHQAIKVKFMQS